MQEEKRLTSSELRGIGLVIIGTATIVFYYSWWGQNGRLQNPWLVFALILSLIYNSIQIIGNWLLYLATHHRQKYCPLEAPELSIDVYVTAYGEEHDLIERSLSAAVNMKGKHTTYLLDDGHDPALPDIATELGAQYLTRGNKKDAKAGNINAALTKTSGDIIVIFDIDHAPKPDFLEKTLPYFAQPEIGFVQVMLTFENEQDGWVARAAAESSLDFYNPTSIGADGLNSATLIGSNALIRRTALDSVGGYKPGLAEDLATSIALHAEGWRSVYVNQPLAPGYAPPDLTAWFTQQLKWARGVFDILLTDYPKYFRKLASGQRISYIVRMTYYWVGPMTGTHLLIALFTLLWGSAEDMANFENYLWHLAPMITMTITIRQLALRRWRHRSLQSSLQWKPMALVFSTWPIYFIAWIMAIFRIPLGFRLTPKSSSGHLNPLWLLPQMVSCIFLFTGILKWVFLVNDHFYPLTLGFAMALIMPQVALLGKRLLTAVAAPLLANGKQKLQLNIWL